MSKTKWERIGTFPWKTKPEEKKKKESEKKKPDSKEEKESSPEMMNLKILVMISKMAISNTLVLDWEKVILFTIIWLVTRSIGDYISDYLGLGLVLAVGAAIIYFLAGKGEAGSAAFEPVRKFFQSRCLKLKKK